MVESLELRTGWQIRRLGKGMSGDLRWLPQRRSHRRGSGGRFTTKRSDQLNIQIVSLRSRLMDRFEVLPQGVKATVKAGILDGVTIFASDDVKDFVSVARPHVTLIGLQISISHGT